MYMTLAGSDKDKVGRICQILPKVPQSASKCLKVAQTASKSAPKCSKQGANRPICKNPQKGGEMRT